MDLRKPRGLERRKNKDGSVRLYWRPNERARSLGFQPSVIPIFVENEIELRSLCAQYEAEMLEWIAQREGASNPGPKHVTIATLFRAYRGRPESPFQSVKWNTRRTYSQTLDLIEGAVGNVRLDDINLGTIKRWYDAAHGDGHVRKAHGVVSMLRRAVSFGVAAEIHGCDRLSRT